jgi:PhoH-like ATPase
LADSDPSVIPTAFILDTSVFIHDPHCIDSFGEAVVVVPLRVVEELDDVKAKGDVRAAYAREASRVLERYRKAGDLRHKGVPTEAGGRLHIAYGAESWEALNGLGRGLERKNDNLILLVAKNWKKHHEDQRVVIVTLDTNMRIKAAALDIEAEEYSDGDRPNLEELYTGQRDIEIEDNGVFQQLSTDLYRQGSIEVAALSGLVDLETLQPNECCTLRCGDRGTLATYKREAQEFVFVPKPTKLSKNGVKPRNATQSYAFALCSDPGIELLTLTGAAGAGKTLMAVLAGYEQLGTRYKRIIVYRPIYEVGGKELGYLPGDLNKKFGPWARPILDNLELIFEDVAGSNYTVIDEIAMTEDNIDITTDRGSIAISPIIYIRGRSLHDSFVIVDEAQNLSPNDVKSLVTRAGRGTKMVITGDPTQIDNRYLDAGTNGLVGAIRNFSAMGWEKFGHINMTRSERSELADVAAKIL